MDNRKYITKNIFSTTFQETLDLTDNFCAMFEDYEFLMSLNSEEQQELIRECTDEELDYAAYLLSEEYMSFLVLSENFSNMSFAEQNTLLNEAYEFMNDSQILTEANEEVKKNIFKRAGEAVSGFFNRAKENIGNAILTAGGAIRTAAPYVLPTAAVLGTAMGVGFKIGKVKHARRRYSNSLINSRQTKLDSLINSKKGKTGKDAEFTEKELKEKKRLEKEIKNLKAYSAKQGLFHNFKKNMEVKKNLRAGNFKQYGNEEGKIYDVNGKEITDKDYFKKRENKEKLKAIVADEQKKRKEQEKDGKEMTLKDIKDNKEIKGIAGGIINDKGIEQYLDDKK